MDKELIDLIFTHIKGLGEGGAEMLKWYLLAYYGYSIANILLIGGSLVYIIRFIAIKIHSGASVISLHAETLREISHILRIGDIYMGSEMSMKRLKNAVIELKKQNNK